MFSFMVMNSFGRFECVIMWVKTIIVGTYFIHVTFQKKYHILKTILQLIFTKYNNCIILSSVYLTKNVMNILQFGSYHQKI